MKNLKLVTFLLVVALLTAGFSLPGGWAAEAFSAPSLTASSPTNQLYALDITRFHFMSLKHFHSILFSSNQYRGFFTEPDAKLLNVGLNAFLSSKDRESLLLEALRADKAVRLRFMIPEKSPGDFEMINHPTKPLLYRLEPEVKRVPVVVRIQPLLDGPVAFQITVEKDGENLNYDVDWAGQVIGFSRKKAA
jgi:hypothetical protein